MALDATDKKLTNGLIMFGVLAVVLYFLPGFNVAGSYIGGYQALATYEEQQEVKLQDVNKTQYVKHYAGMEPGHFGQSVADLPPPSTGTLAKDILAAYGQQLDRDQQLIGEAESKSKIEFDAWTEIPEGTRQPGVYFAATWDKHRVLLENEWRVAGVECLDPLIGFGKNRYRGDVIKEEIKAREYLRELYITEKIIRLCIEAKKHQEEAEKMYPMKTHAFMRIRSVTPQDSVPTGPSALIPNLQYDKDEKDPRSPKFRKYKVQLWKNFIQEYPVEIVLQCDLNTFMRFLHSVRQERQFLVIRNLEIMSPAMQDSTESADNEFSDFCNGAGEEQTKALRDEPYLLVRMSASGMDFFDPVKFPNGLYSVRQEKKVRPTHVVPLSE